MRSAPPDPRSNVQGRSGVALISLALVVSLFLLQPLASQASYATLAASTRTSTTKASTMGFGVVDESASYGIPSYKNAAVQQADLSMLVSTGAQCVRVDIGYAPWLPGGNASQAQLVTAVVKSIRSQGKCLIISDAGSKSYRNGGCLNWAEFKVAWVQRVSTLRPSSIPDTTSSSRSRAGMSRWSATRPPTPSTKASLTGSA